jgi:hypothetical protein
MAYDFHITRAVDWADSMQNPISADEWLSFVESDDESSLFKENGDYFAVWKNDVAWFDWNGGESYTKNPDKLTISKMLQIAGKLNAKVQGVEGESIDYKILDSQGF